VKVSDGLYRVEGVRGANSYVVETGDGLLLVDTGMPGNAERILAFLRDIGHEPADVRTIAITHSDIDHVGSAARLKALTGAKVAIHADDAPVLAGNGEGKKAKGSLGVVFSVLRRFMRAEPVVADVILHEGDTVSGYEVMHTPGHTQGSITLHRDGVVFPGDALLGDAEGHERPPRESIAADYPQALASAERIRALGYRILLPGHGEPVFAGKAGEPR
jgi:glyoxylase-like metal-dependent hydrolase (beta-lactamase superfamily II)